MQSQVYIFIIFILNGILIGIFFDIFRILRKSFKTSDIVTYIEDIIFSIFTGILILYSIMKFNNGEIRFYLFLGIILGLIFYLLTFSSVFIKISVNLILLLKKIVNIIIIIPFKYISKGIRKVIVKPVVFICINIKHLFKKIAHFSKHFYKNLRK